MVDESTSTGLREKLRALLPSLTQEFSVASLALFGSFVREEETDGSDLDLLVEFREAPSLFRFIELENLLTDELGVDVDLVMKDALKPRIRQRILQDIEPI
ncbi:MAG: DNA polymerase III subunit beta [Chloroflexi bacterium]|nr:MAG: DNA polymerase III subunit beta [Chloroflexota bacterium]